MNRMKRFVMVMMTACMICVFSVSPTFAAGCNHKNYGRSTEIVRPSVCYKVVSSRKVGGPVYGGWIVKGKQRVNGLESATTLRGKSYSVERTVSANLTGKIPAPAMMKAEAKIGVTQTWKKSKFTARAYNSARNGRDNKTRWIAYCIRNRYQEYEVVYVAQDQHWCTKCGKIWYTDQKTRKPVRLVKKEGVEGAYFYSDSKKNFESNRCGTFRTHGITYEKGGNYLMKGNSFLTGSATYKNQNYNAYSNIKYWR